MPLNSPQNTGGVVVNGVRFDQAPGFAFTPTGYVPYAAQGASRPPTLPPSAGGFGGANGVAGSAGEPSTYASANDNAALVAQAQANPWSPGASPVVPALIMLAISLLLLHFVHFRSIPT